MDNIIGLADKIIFNCSENHLAKFNGQEAVVMSVISNGGYDITVRFYESEIEDEYAKNRWYFKNEWLTKTGTDMESYQRFTEEARIKEEEAAYKRKYAWGRCEKCDGPLDMYYKLWCPNCEKPEVKTVKTLNFFTMAKYLEAHGRPGAKERLWDWLCERDDVRNDVTITFWLTPEEMSNEELATDIQTIKDTWNLTEESIQMEISW